MPDIQQLIDQLPIWNPNTRQNVSFTTLVEMGQAAVEPLIAAIHHPNPEVRAMIARVLEKIGDVRSIPALITLTQDPTQPTCTAAITALGGFQSNPQAIEFLRQFALSNNPPETRVHAIHALKHAAGQEATLMVCLHLLNDPTHYMVINAAHQLGSSKNPAMLEPLVSTLNRYATTPNKALVILQALGNLGDPRALQPIAAYLQSPEAQVRGAAVSALQSLGDPRAIAFLEPLTRDRGAAYQDELPSGTLGRIHTVGEMARDAIKHLRKQHDLPNAKPRWKLW